MKTSPIFMPSYYYTGNNLNSNTKSYYFYYLWNSVLSVPARCRGLVLRVPVPSGQSYTTSLDYLHHCFSPLARITETGSYSIKTGSRKTRNGYCLMNISDGTNSTPFYIRTGKFSNLPVTGGKPINYGKQKFNFACFVASTGGRQFLAQLCK